MNLLAVCLCSRHGPCGALNWNMLRRGLFLARLLAHLVFLGSEENQILYRELKAPTGRVSQTHRGPVSCGSVWACGYLSSNPAARVSAVVAWEFSGFGRGATAADVLLQLFENRTLFDVLLLMTWWVCSGHVRETTENGGLRVWRCSEEGWASALMWCRAADCPLFCWSPRGLLELLRVRRLVCVDNQALALGGDEAGVPLELPQAAFQSKAQDELRAPPGSARGVRREAPLQGSDLRIALAAGELAL